MYLQQKPPSSSERWNKDFICALLRLYLPVCVPAPPHPHPPMMLAVPTCHQDQTPGLRTRRSRAVTRCHGYRNYMRLPLKSLANTDSSFCLQEGRAGFAITYIRWRLPHEYMWQFEASTALCQHRIRVVVKTSFLAVLSYAVCGIPLHMLKSPSGFQKLFFSF